MSCRRPPPWFDKTPGHDPGAWEEARRQCRTILEYWAREGQPHTYTELIREIPAIPWPEGAFTRSGSQVGWLLGQVSVEEWLEHRPVLSALVVQASGNEAGYPGKGFFNLARELGLLRGTSREEELTFWAEEVERCREQARSPQ